MLEKIRTVSDREKQELQLDWPEGESFIVELDRVIEERCDELDMILEEHGYYIFHRDYITIATSIFNYRVYFSQAKDS
jgi:hypothetical protein